MATRHERHQIEAKQLPALLKGPAANIPAGEGLTLKAGGPGKKASWFFRYTYKVTGKPNSITHRERSWLAADGKVAGCSLEEAYAWHDAQMALVAAGLDPNIERDKLEAKAKQEEGKRQEQAAANAEQSQWEASVQAWRTKFDAWRASRARPLQCDMPRAPHGTFARACDDYCTSLEGLRSPKTIAWMRMAYAKHCHPHFGHKHCRDVNKHDILKMDKGSIKSAAKALRKLRRDYLVEVFQWMQHPEQDLRVEDHPIFPEGQLFTTMPKSKPHPALVEPDDIRWLMRDIKRAPLFPEKGSTSNQEVTVTSLAVLEFLAYTGQRIDSTVTARRTDIDLDAGVWTIPAVRMKGKLLEKTADDAQPHIVYLSTQAKEVLERVYAANPDSEWVFPGFGKNNVCASTVTARLRELGYEGKHTPHGFRAMLRTAGEVYAGLDPLVLEAMGLGHKGAKDEAKDKTKLLEEARKLLKEMLDGDDTQQQEEEVADDDSMTFGLKKIYKRGTEKRRMTWEDKCRATMQGWGNWLQEIQRPQLKLAA